MENYLEIIQNKYLQKKDSSFRFGSIEDGGYLITPKYLLEADFLFSGGISSNVEFEYDVFRYNKTIQIIGIDPTVSKSKLLLKALVRPFFGKSNKLRYLINVLNFIDLQYTGRFTHIAKWLNKDFGIFDAFKSLNLSIEKKKILLKLDIEGSEYDLLNEIVVNKECFTCMVFEFHDLDKKSDLLLDFLSNLESDFSLTSIEINPSGGFFSSNLPKNIEITLERK